MFARTCKLLNLNATPILYKFLVITDYIDYDHFPRLTNGHIWYGPRNLPLIERLDVSMPWHCMSDGGDSQSASLNYIGDMPNLRQMTIEFREGDDLPHWQNRRTMYLPSPVLANLQTCILNFTAGDWDITGIVPLLQHPNLLCLEMHAAASDPLSKDVEFDDEDDYEGLECESPKSTSLVSLTLVDCDLVLDDFHQMLCFPKALEYLSVYATKPDNEGGL
ncbi:hypothetical protein ONS95_006591 [Cadophora gregata]|uniref:uncharacterized protein n=1 Tax=Cadophora gregata TaxID=51156 RepID=UPI0026DBB3C4|nr:uncharacterized protein ONS95_006591 [Cadophora gregata]KAK0101419.1 hypothetical protein ONS95_006591 [Cadophora gregata]KAK0106570.1 hypothetical protein ONS96_004192 [Cadophora gregata f. sp. sojae]